jgi:hypothetical protein
LRMSNPVPPRRPLVSGTSSPPGDLFRVGHVASTAPLPPWPFTEPVPGARNCLTFPWRDSAPSMRPERYTGPHDVRPAITSNANVEFLRLSYGIIAVSSIPEMLMESRKSELSNYCGCKNTTTRRHSHGPLPVTPTNPTGSPHLESAPPNP